MTRDEEIRNAIDTIIPILPSNNGRTYEQALMAAGFEYGVSWADSHPTNMWHDANEEPKCKKICTDTLQSKKLAEILPLESADMYYSKHSLENYYSPIPNIGKYSVMHNQMPCWSISALLEVIRNNGRYELQMFEGGYYFEANGFMTESYFNPVDACYEFILKLYELNML